MIADTIKHKREADIKSINKEIGMRIKTFRENKGMSQSVLGELIGVSYQQIQKYENGITPVTIERLLQIGTALELSPSDFLSDTFVGKISEGIQVYKDAGVKLKRLASTLSAQEILLLKTFRSVGNEKLKRNILSHIKVIAKFGKK